MTLHRFRGAFVALLMFTAGLPAAFAQVDDKPFLEQDRRKAMEETFEKPVPEVQEFLYDFGGWYHFEFLEFGDQPFEDTRVLRYHDMRLWASCQIDRKYRVYARLRSTVADFNEGTQFGVDEDRYKLLRLDQGYVEAPFHEAATSIFGQESTLDVRFGRQLFMIGTGLLLNNVQDGLYARSVTGLFQIKFMASTTIRSDDDLDRSRPESDDMARLFVGTEVAYRAAGSHRPYGAIVLQKDFNKDGLATQEFGYNSVYVAVGMKGYIATGVGYSTEFDYETGTSIGSGTSSEEDISAWAFQLNLECYAKTDLSPVFFFTYLYGSGDSNRGSATDTIGGNKPGTADRSFLAYGFLQTGYALSPRVANIHIVRLGFSLKPAENTDWGQDLDVGGAYYLYAKAQSEESISDSRSFLDDEDVGTAFDLFMRWKAYSDLTMAINFGVFFPGDAYVEDSRRDFLSVGMTYSF